MMEIKCENCGCVELMPKELDIQEEVHYVIWECVECGNLYKACYRLEEIVKLQREADEK